VSEPLRIDDAARCDRCGGLSPFDLGDRRLCEECYGLAGSCCPEFGADDLWAEREQEGHGILHRFFAADHDRLDDLLRRACAADRIDLELIGRFRAGLLRHIGMEEKVLLVAAREARGGRPLPIAERLRVDHGAIASLLVPTPTPAIVAELLAVLGPHNRREEEPGGAYDACDQAIGRAAAAQLVEGLRAFPEAPLKPWTDGPEVMKHIQVNLELSRRQWAEMDGPTG
jgi:hypothetical protein